MENSNDFLLTLTTRSTLAKITSPDLGAAGAIREREREIGSCEMISQLKRM